MEPEVAMMKEGVIGLKIFIKGLVYFTNIFIKKNSESSF